MELVASLDLFEDADVVAEEVLDVPPALLFPKALLTRIGVSYFTSEKVFED